MPRLQTTLENNVVHVWNVEMRREDDQSIRSCWTMLSIDEKERAERFKYKKDHQSFVIARGVLRRLLGLYLRCSPVELLFAYDDRGKPLIQGSRPIEFNLSHSGDLVAVAISANRAVGIDVEKVRPLADIESVVTSFFSPDEAKQISLVHRKHRKDAFFRCWTRKEAWLKGMGTGLSTSLNAFSVPALPEPGRFLFTGGHGETWVLTDINPLPAGYVGTVACPIAIRNLQIFPPMTHTALIDDLG